MYIIGSGGNVARMRVETAIDNDHKREEKTVCEV